ncbi:unnamed protein product [Caenorhabditis angaria]|uniref:Protein Wnt n=1 Tax=Caenorhabditis angaria TaxID=860376 RepID=A0A9P1N5V9_9PELO|nr:unnamed protein product [Caenorhabditis angaria]
MQKHVVQFILFAIFVNTQEIPYNWLTLAFVGNSEYQPRPHYQSFDKEHFKDLCRRLDGLNTIQQTMCAENPFAIPFIARGVREAIRECETKFTMERWNCSSRDEVTETKHGKFQDILGKTFRSGNKEAAFLTALMSASIVHSITKGCNTGNLTDCGCDSKPGMQRYIAENDGSTALNRDQFSWGGCSDNVPYGLRYARRFLDDFDQKEFEETKNVINLVRKHNNFVGREAIAQNIRRQCRCHGVSGSCEFKTCWLQMPKFAQVSDLLKKRYDHFSVQVTRKATKRLRRKERSERKIPLRGNEMAFVHRSPSYCERNDTAGILGTTGRECLHNSYNSESCDLLCCGRGYNTRLEVRETQCECKFVWCCEVKCKTCTEEVAVHTCK